jgi:NADPH2 dehydrogenase
MPDPVPTFAEVVTRIRDDHPDFAYIHVLEPTIHHRPVGARESETGKYEDSNKFLRDIWGDRPYIANCGLGRNSAIDLVEKEGGLVSFGRHFISNVSRVMLGLVLSLTCSQLTCSRLIARSPPSPETQY